MNHQHTVDIQQLEWERDEMEARYLKAAIDNVRLRDKTDELNRSAILTDLRAKIMGEQLRIKGEKVEHELHSLYRGIFYSSQLYFLLFNRLIIRFLVRMQH